MPRGGGFLREVAARDKNLGPSKPGTSTHLSCAAEDICADFGYGSVVKPTAVRARETRERT